MRLSEKIHLLKQEFSIPISMEMSIPRSVNFYVIEGKALYLVDCGTRESFQLLKAYLPTIGRKLEEVRAVFLTHAHPDHIGSLKLLQQHTDCEVYVHASEKYWVEDTALQFKERPVPGFQQLVAGNARVTHPFRNDELLALEPGLVLDVLHTPGHSDGSVSYYLKSEQALFSGDAVLLPGEIPIYTHVEKYRDSLEKIGNLPVTTTILSAFDQPKSGEEFADVLEGSLQYIVHIGEVVCRLVPDLDRTRPMEFCRKVVAALRMPESLTNPLLLKSFLAHLNNTYDTIS